MKIYIYNEGLINVKDIKLKNNESNILIECEQGNLKDV